MNSVRVMEERKDNYNVPIGGRDMGMFNEFINDMEVDNVHDILSLFFYF